MIPAWIRNLYQLAKADLRERKRRRRAAKLARWYARDGRSRLTRPTVDGERVKAWRLDRLEAKRRLVREAKARSRLARQRIRKANPELWFLCTRMLGHRELSAQCARSTIPRPGDGLCWAYFWDLARRPLFSVEPLRFAGDDILAFSVTEDDLARVAESFKIPGKLIQPETANRAIAQ